MLRQDCAGREVIVSELQLRVNDLQEEVTDLQGKTTSISSAKMKRRLLNGWITRRNGVLDYSVFFFWGGVVNLDIGQNVVVVVVVLVKLRCVE